MTRRLELGPLAAATGALLLLVSLFLDWYGPEPAISAFTAFEVLDLVLAGIALAVAGAGVMQLTGHAPSPGVDRAVPWLAVVAVTIVGSQVINHPPAGVGADAEVGQWLGLGGALAMAAGAVLGRARISLAVNVASRAAGEEPPRAPAPEPSAAPVAPGADVPPVATSAPEEARAAEPEVKDELYPETERTRPIGADDPETARVRPASADDSETAQLDRPAPER